MLGSAQRAVVYTRWHVEARGARSRGRVPGAKLSSVLLGFRHRSEFVFLQGCARVLQTSVAEVPVPQTQGA